LVDDIIAVVKSSNTNEVQAGICPHDIRAAKRRAEVSPAISYVSHSTVSTIKFLCLRHFCMLAIFPVPATFYVSAILLSESDLYQTFHVVCQPFKMTQSL
jgi:hypothetical protein